MYSHSFKFQSPNINSFWTSHHTKTSTHQKTKTRSVALCGKIPPILCPDTVSHIVIVGNHFFLHLSDYYILAIVIVHQHIWFACRDQWYKKHNTDKHSMKFWTITVTLNTAVQTEMLWPMRSTIKVWEQKDRQFRRQSGIRVWLLIITSYIYKAPFLTGAHNTLQLLTTFTMKNTHAPQNTRCTESSRYNLLITHSHTPIHVLLGKGEF